MNKDVIYIDVEDDITAIIGKIKQSKHKVVALVPPKRVGVLQSAVNMRLLGRAATNGDKRLVLITNNSSLGGLAAAAKIPVARNLQSKPELAEIPALAIDDGDDVIEGEQLPVGEHAKTAPVEPKSSSLDSAIDDMEVEDELKARAVPPAAGKVAKPKAKKGAKVPNFNRFRKKLLLIAGLGLLLIGFLIWFAPRATVVITAKTTPASVNQTLTLSQGAATNFDSKQLKIEEAKKTDDLSVDFEATGKKQVGEKASGTMTVSRNRASPKASSLPAGTTFTSGDYVFESTADVSIPASGIDYENSRIDNGSAQVSVRATEIGSEYNLNARSYASSASGFSGQGSEMTGGSKKSIKVVSQSDVNQAMKALEDKLDDTMEDKLADEFSKDTTPIKETYKVIKANTKSSPAVGDEATKATLSSEVAYRMFGAAKAELDSFLDEAVESQIGDQHDQQVYENGRKDIKFSDLTESNDRVSIQLTTTGQTGPKIDEAKTKTDVAGAKYGDVQSKLESIDGVSDVDVKFWPFWVRTVPKDVKKITIQFKLQNES